MLVYNKSGFTTHSDIQIQTSLSKLGVSISDTGTIDPTTVKLQIYRNDGKTGQKEVLPKTLLKDLFIINAALEREAFFKFIATKFEGSVDLTPDGRAISLHDNDYLSVEITGVNTTATVRLFAIDTPVNGDMITQYEHMQVLAGGNTQTFNVADYSHIAVEVANISKLQIDYPEKSITMDDTEFPLIGDEIQGISEVSDYTNDGADFIYLGTNKLLVLDVTTASQIRITPNIDTTFRCYKMKPVKW